MSKKLSSKQSAALADLFVLFGPAMEAVRVPKKQLSLIIGSAAVKKFTVDAGQIINNGRHDMVSFNGDYLDIADVCYEILSLEDPNFHKKAVDRLKVIWPIK